MITRSSSHALDSGQGLFTPAFRNAALAGALMILASALFALQAALVKAGLQKMAPLELVFFRGLICAVLILAVARWRGLSLATAQPAAQVWLGVIGFASLALYFFSIGMLPLVTATALCYTSPLFLAVVLGAQSARAARAALLVWVAGGFLGVCLVLQPSLAGGSSMGVMLGLLSGITGAGGYLLLSRLGRSGEPERVTGFYFSLVVCILAGVPSLLAGFSIATWQQFGIVLAIGLLATAAQLAVGRAYALGSPLVPATVSYSAVIFSSLLGAWWWGDQLGFMETAGITLIVASGILVSAGQARPEKPKGTPMTANDSDCLREKRRKRENLRNNLRSLYAAVMLAKFPERVKYVFMMGDAQDQIAESERVRGDSTDPFTSPALEAMWQMRYQPAPYEIEPLLQLPAGTLGGDYARHMKANNLRPDFYEDVAPRHRQHYLRLRMRQTHDIWHVLAGFGTDEFGEVGLQGFYFAQFTNGQSAIIGGGAMLRCVLSGRFGDLERTIDAFCEGYCKGKLAESLLAVKWEELWDEPLESLRTRYRIELPQLRAPAGGLAVSG
jgi:ubiquinone biosynthesis protein Coq4/drug/metabolite transporter (DMT)-like permease